MATDFVKKMANSVPQALKTEWDIATTWPKNWRILSNISGYKGLIFASFHHLKALYVQMMDLYLILQFVKGRCHGGQIMLRKCYQRRLIQLANGLYARLCHGFLVSYFLSFTFLSFLMISERQIISRSAGPIFAIF